MKRMLKRILKNRGDVYIDTLISSFVITVFIAIIIVTLPVFIRKYHLDMFANQVSTFVSVSGGTETINVEQLAEEMGIDLGSYSITPADDAVYRSDTADPLSMRIQLTGRYTVNVETTVYIGLGGVVGPLPIRLVSSAQGRSEVYWKDLEA